VQIAARTRVFVYGFLALVLVCGLFALEYWPLTGWRLYHEPRKPTHPSWELALVDAAGDERTVTLYDLPVAYRNTERLLGRTAEVDPEQAARICAAWAEPFHTFDPDAEALRIYRTRIVARSGAPLSRQLVQACKVPA
jgi:hypothetical protein